MSALVAARMAGARAGFFVLLSVGSFTDWPESLRTVVSCWSIASNGIERQIADFCVNASGFQVFRAEGVPSKNRKPLEESCDMGLPKFSLRSLALLAGLFAPAPSMAATLEEMAGQMILIGFQGNSVDAPGVTAVRADIAAGRIGGVMYLRNNVRSLDVVEQMNSAFLGATQGLVPLIALDQEGGSIERLTEAVGFREIPSAERVAASQSPEQARQTYLSMALELAALKFNLNLGPVVDLNLNPDNPIIARYGRSFGADAGQVSQYATSFISAHRAAGVLTALKHFPGHGSSRADSHKGFVDITRYWQPEELTP
ncbi:MAG TPA: glycoside hydrolase family 3 protein, partial [Devosia sp.]|nr:glycoside hydrolase family 3 protein [Devosia sp.]